MPRTNDSVTGRLERLKELAADLPALLGSKTPVAHATAEYIRREVDAVLRALRRSAPRKPPKPGEVSDPRQELQAMLRGVADDIDALGEFAVAIDQRKTQLLSASARVHRGRPSIN